MKKILVIALLCMGMLPFTAVDSAAQHYGVDGISINYCDSQLKNPNLVTTRKFTPKAFQTLQASTAVEVVYTSTTSQKAQVKVTVTREYADYLVAEVSHGSTLNIYWDTQRLKRDFKRKKFDLAARVEVDAPTPDVIKSESGASISIPQTLTVSKTLTMSATSGSEIEAESIECAALNASTTSGASFEAKSVRCTTANVSVSSGSKVDVERLNASKSVELNASSGSKIDADNLTGDGKVNADASSGSSISLSGKTNGEVSLVASSGASIDAYDLVVPFAIAKASSGAKVKAPKAKELQFKEDSCGDVHWKGTPTVTKIK